MRPIIVLYCLFLMWPRLLTAGTTALCCYDQIDSAAKTITDDPKLYRILGRGVTEQGTCHSWEYTFEDFRITLIDDSIHVSPDSTFKNITGSAPISGHHWIDSDSAMTRVLAATSQTGDKLPPDATVEMNLGRDTAQPWDEWLITISQPGSPRKWFFRLNAWTGELFQSYSTAVIGSYDGPAEFRLDQNYPNPFNLGTTIRFILPQNQKGRLALHSLTGQLLQVLWDGEMTAGEHVLQIRLDNLPSGPYFYSLKTESYFSVKRMLLLK